MHNFRNLSRACARGCSDHPIPAPSDASLTLLRTGVERQTGNLTQFLREAVIDRFKHESGDYTASDLRAAPASDGREDEFSRQSAAAQPAQEAASPSHPAPIPLWKRALDLMLISLTSPLWLPVMILIMVAIKIGSPGPVFYRQQRVGHRGRSFMIFKFRTMKVNVETHVHESHFERLMVSNLPMVKLDSKGDPRLIRFGRFLRAAGLDELPQLFNVWTGKMSLVGPRPCTIHEFEHYEPWQRERVNAPPGLTGFWQVNGKNRTTFSEMIDMDILYGNNMSLRLDLLILLKTIPAVIDQFIEMQGGLWSNWSRQQSFGKQACIFENSPPL